MDIKKYFLSVHFIAIIIVLTISLPSCKTLPPKECLPQQMKDLKIKWGDYIMKDDKLVQGYILHSNGDLYKIEKMQDTIGEKIGNITDEQYCQIHQQVRDEFIKVQVLNVTADTMRFVEYKSVNADITQRAFWNSNFWTQTNSGFFGIFAKLMSFKSSFD